MKNFKHDMETPLATLKTIFHLLEDGMSFDDTLKENAELSLLKIKELVLAADKELKEKQ